MVSLSKSRPRVDEVARGLSCGGFYHPWTPSCAVAVRDMALSGIIGSCKLFTPVYLAQLLVIWRKVNISYLRKEARTCARSMAFTTFAGTMFVASGCILTRLIDHREHVSAFLPAFLGGFGIFLEQPHKRGFHVSTFTSLVLEYVLRQLEECGVFQMSHTLAALLFMASNGLLMYLLRCEYLFPHARLSKNIWFFYPPPVKRKNAVRPESLPENEETVKSPPPICPHKGPCRKHIPMVTSKYMLIGMGLQFIRKGLPQVQGLGKIPSVLLKLFYDRHNMKLGVFLAAYIGIYNVVICMLNYFTGHDSELHAIYAGTMAGLAYCFQPNLTFALSGFTTAIFMLARHLVRQEVVPYVPGLDGVMFAMSFGIMLHARAFETHLCPRLATSMMSTTTNGRCDMIVDIYKKRQEAYART